MSEIFNDENEWSLHLWQLPLSSNESQLSRTYKAAQLRYISVRHGYVLDIHNIYPNNIYD